MKKNLLLLIAFTLLFSNSFAANKNTKKTKKITTMQSVQDYFLPQYKPVSIESFQYNLNHFSDTPEQYNSTDSLPISKTTIEYNNNVALAYTDIWEENAWSKEAKTKIYMKNQSKPDSMITSSFDIATSTWKPEIKLTYVYDGDLVTENNYYSADSLTGAWILSMKTETNYNASNQINEETTSVYYEEIGQWIIMDKEEYTYTDGKLDYTISKFQMPGTTIFTNTNKTEYIYNGAGQIATELYYDWSMITNGWEKSDKTDFNYNNKGNQYLSKEYYWESSTSTWEIIYKDSVLFKNDEIPLVEFYFEKSDVDQSLRIYEKYYYNYDTPQKINEIGLAENTFLVYPNPSSDFVNIAIQQPKNASFMMYDMTGKIVKQQNLTSETTVFPAKSFQKGNYVLKIKNNGKIHTQLLQIK